MPAEPRPAATVVLLRARGRRFQVFLVRRNRRVGFMPSAWVFPGGRVDEADHVASHPRIVGGDGLSAEDRAYRVAAVRETLEESGLWLGPGAAPPAARKTLNAGEGRLVDILEPHDLQADLDRLRAWSWWITPVAERRRYDTRFFVAVVGDDDAPARHDEGETVDSAWLDIDRAVSGAEAGELPMAPPTWWTLRELEACGDLDAVRASRRPHAPICPILELEAGSVRLVLPGHPEHPDPAIPGLPAELGFTQGRWWAR
jgi:8-oxo-dGTP pyrophosphatase MutT (NUDIX family)